MLARRLLAGSGGSGGFTVPAHSLVGLVNGQSTGGEYGIGALSKAPAGSWTPYGSNPVLTKGTAGAWDDDHVKDPMLLWDGSQYVVYYSGHDGTKYQIGRATASSHEGPWTKDAGNPVLTVGSGGAFDDAGVNFATVLHEPTDTGKEWKIWYGANDGAVQSIGYAHSSDGVSWTKVGQVLVKGSSGTWEDVGVLPMAVVKDGATYNLFYGGRQGTTNPRWQGGLVTFTDPEGTYTRSANNPALLARFNDAGTSQALTANASGGATTLSVASTAAWHVNEPLILADADSESEVHSIISIDSGTQITVSALSSAFTTANGAVLRPVAFNSVLARTVRAVSGGWEMFGEPFQPVEDLSPGGSKLREMSFRWTAASLDPTSWTYDYTTGLMLSYYPANTGWGKFSAENPSVIEQP